MGEKENIGFLNTTELPDKIIDSCYFVCWYAIHKARRHTNKGVKDL